MKILFVEDDRKPAALWRKVSMSKVMDYNGCGIVNKHGEDIYSEKGNRGLRIPCEPRVIR